VGDMRELVREHLHIELSITLPSHACFLSRRAECPVWAAPGYRADPGLTPWRTKMVNARFEI
jgi:hypothetical protein